jgi:hypothetical protein
MDIIPNEIALKLCSKIQEDLRTQWYSLDYWQCVGCNILAYNEVADRCFKSASGNRGCHLLNQRYEKFSREIRVVA